MGRHVSIIHHAAVLERGNEKRPVEAGPLCVLGLDEILVMRLGKR